MTSTVKNTVQATLLIVLALAVVAMGIYVAEVDDAPGAAGMALLLLVAAVAIGVKVMRNRMPVWAVRTALAVGVIVAALAASLTHAVAVSAPLFAEAQNVPSVADSAPAPQYAAAVERARELVRAAIQAQNLPGVSVAVGVGGTIVWTEGFGWRDADTRTPVTPNTRFNIGTAARAVPASVVTALGLTNTGAEPAAEWSPEHVGEPEEDFPPFTVLRHVVLQPLGLAPAEYPLAGERATFYVPRTDDDNPRRGRRLMYMRDLACCAENLASYSTASDLVRAGLANGDSIDGELAGGMVASLVTLRDSGIVVAVLSNIAHANTAAIAQKVGEALRLSGTASSDASPARSGLHLVFE